MVSIGELYQAEIFDLKIIEIAKKVRKEIVSYYGTTKGTCLDASRTLLRELGRCTLKCNPIIAFGEFLLDSNNCKATHFWVEINDKILDVTADQFNPWVEFNIPEIIYTYYDNFPRYRVEDKGWKR